jgi:MtfA peptidase
MVFDLLKTRRRRRLRAQAFPRVWRTFVERNVPLFRRMPEDDRGELLGHVQVFLAEKRFEGCGGLELTDEIRVTIAAQACLLLLHRDTDYFPDLTTVLVYPTEYTEHGERHIGGGLWEEGPEDRLGHTAMRLRAMVLAWDAVARGGRPSPGGGNLVIHEFAHQLDFENSGTDGIPALDSAREYAEWKAVLHTELSALRAADAAGRPTVLDTYGAMNEAEFFAVATETFFERPVVLRAHHPRLYRALQTFFRQDPAAWWGDEPPEAV